MAQIPQSHCSYHDLVDFLDCIFLYLLYALRKISRDFQLFKNFCPDKWLFIGVWAALLTPPLWKSYIRFYLLSCEQILSLADIDEASSYVVSYSMEETYIVSYPQGPEGSSDRGNSNKKLPVDLNSANNRVSLGMSLSPAEPQGATTALAQGLIAAFVRSWSRGSGYIYIYIYKGI